MPVTVTEPNVIRFFMTISEATRLVLLAGACSYGRDLFVLDMDEPMKLSISLGAWLRFREGQLRMRKILMVI